MDTSFPSGENRNWHFRFVIGRRRVTVAIPPTFFLTLMVVSLLSFVVGSGIGGADNRRQAKLLAELQQNNETLKQVVAKKELERDQMVVLAETRSDELWGELEDREHELARLWRIVGEKPSNNHRQRLTLSARGHSNKPALAVKAEFNALSSQITENGQELKSLSQAANHYRVARANAERQRRAKMTPSGVPCQGEMTSGFGSRYHPVLGFNKVHNGCDFTAPYGTAIHATADGKVFSSGWLGGYGQTIEIDHGNGLKTLYAHCETLKVTKGQQVRKGQLIATVGTTGLSSGPHCHYEVHKNDKPVDPKTYLPRSAKKVPKPVSR